MKKYILFILTTILLSCNQNSESNTEISNSETIKVLNQEEFAKEISKQNVQLIDVRTTQEFESGHLKGALHYHIYDKDFGKRVAELDKSKPVYIYCKAGSRSQEASEELKKLGFTKIYDLQGGISTWTGEIEK